LYLRHPLADHTGWMQLEETANSTGIAANPDNTTWSYMNYVAALGWLTPDAYALAKAARTGSTTARTLAMAG